MSLLCLGSFLVRAHLYVCFDPRGTHAEQGGPACSNLPMARVFACMPTHTRSLHIADANASGEYFDYSIDELGLQDIRAADRVISNVVCNELASS